MKRLAQIGKIITNTQMKSILGGYVPPEELEPSANCTARCTGGKNVSCPTGTNKCSATDDVGVTCDGVQTKCTKLD